MVDDGVIGRDPAVRVAAGGEDDSAREDLLAAAREPGTSVLTTGTGSMGQAALEPLVLATLDGETAFVSAPNAEEIREIVTDLDDGTLPSEDALAVVEHESETMELPRPADGALAVGTPTVLAACGWADPTEIEDYRDTPLAADVDNTVEALEETGLRGRGRGDGATDTPVANDWETVAATDGDPVVVVNANEADPNAGMDRLLLESTPFSVLDPALAAAATLGATDLVIYGNEAQPLACERAEAAANALAADLDIDTEIRLVMGPDEYKASEPTMALEAIEGNHRLEARRTPPGPSEYGVDGRPTLVHTPRTFAQIGHVLDGESESGAADPGTRLFTVTGEHTAPATVELATDGTLDAVLPAVGADGRTRACVGGVFGGLTRSLDVPASAPGLNSAGLGTNGVVEVLDGSTCPVAFAGERAAFAKEENCGRCVPCREGSKQLVNLLRDVYDGEYKDGMLRELTRTMDGTSLCGFGRDAARPVRTAMATFETEFAAHAEGRCPTGACDL